jgi:tRNA pseudouridine13 synthase
MSENGADVPRKRPRLEGPDNGNEDVAFSEPVPESTEETKVQLKSAPELRVDGPWKEHRAGITKFVSPDTPGFSGVFKQRYSDFLVNEIMPSGEVLHLVDIARPGAAKMQAEEEPKTVETAPAEVPSVPEAVVAPNEESEDAPAREVTISDEDSATLVEIFDEDTAQNIKKLYQEVLKHPDRRRRDFNSIQSECIEEKDDRTKAHHAVRRIFSGNLETETDDSNKIVIKANPKRPGSKSKQHGQRGNQNRPRGKQVWDEFGGDNLHFTLYKENKDTMEIMYHLASQMRLGIKSFSFAGTKDRRAITVQRVSAHRVQVERLAGLSKSLRQAKIGGFKYEKAPLTLGAASGNEFGVTLRNCEFPGTESLDFDERLTVAKTLVGTAIEAWKTGGFINYYGLQRFGSFENSTDEVGVKLLQGNLEAATKLILAYSPEILKIAQAGDDG